MIVRENFNKFCIVLTILFMGIHICSSQNDSRTNVNYTEVFKSNHNSDVNSFKLNYNVVLTLGYYESGTLESRLIEIPILLKYQATAKLSLLAGPKFDFYRDKGVLTKDVGVSTSFGLQYNLNTKTFIQANFNYKLNEVQNNMHYNSTRPSSYIIRSGFKF